MDVCDCAFINNNATHAIVLVQNTTWIETSGTLIIESNKADLAVIYLGDTTGTFSGSLTFLNNIGSLMLVRSNVSFIGHAEFVNSSSLREFEAYFEAGAISVYEFSIIEFSGYCVLQNNRAKNGAAFYVV